MIYPSLCKSPYTLLFFSTNTGASQFLTLFATFIIDLNGDVSLVTVPMDTPASGLVPAQYFYIHIHVYTYISEFIISLTIIVFAAVRC